MQMSLGALTHFILALHLLGYKLCGRTRHSKRPDQRHIYLLLIHLHRKLLKDLNNFLVCLLLTSLGAVVSLGVFLFLL